MTLFGIFYLLNLVYSILNYSSFLALKQLENCRCNKSVWNLLEWNWRDFEKEKNYIHVLASANKLKSHRRPGNKIFTISIHKPTCLELGGVSWERMRTRNEQKLYSNQTCLLECTRTNDQTAWNQSDSIPRTEKNLTHVLWVFIISFGPLTGIFSS